MCEQAAAESCCFFVHISILEIHEKRTMRNEKKNNVSSDARSSMTCSMGAATTAMAAEDSATEENAEAADTTEASDADQEAADNVAALIDKIYVQERNDTTDETARQPKKHGML